MGCDIRAIGMKPSRRYVVAMSQISVEPNRRRDPQETRALVLDMAIEVLVEKGAQGLTLDAVVERLPFSKGALLHHFPSKMALLEGVIDRLGEDLVAQVEARAAMDPQPYGRAARAYLDTVISGVMTPRDVSIGRAALGACAIEPSLSQRWAGWVNRARQDDPGDAVGADDALLLRLVADGLWMSDVFEIYGISEEQRRALASLLLPKMPGQETGR